MRDWQEIIHELVGKPFVMNGRGPENYDCWGLILRVIELRKMPFPGDWTVPENCQNEFIVSTFETESKRSMWKQSDQPISGSIVALSTHKRIHHVGIQTPFGVLHTVRKLGAIIETELMLRFSGYQRIEYYRWVK